MVRGGGDHGFARLPKNLAQQNRLKLPARLADLVGVGNIRIRRQFFDRQVRGLDMRLERRKYPYQRMINSACKAPACFMAWNIDIMSRGVTPEGIQSGGHFFHRGQFRQGDHARPFPP